MRGGIKMSEPSIVEKAKEKPTTIKASNIEIAKPQSKHTRMMWLCEDAEHERPLAFESPSHAEIHKSEHPTHVINYRPVEFD